MPAHTVADAGEYISTNAVLPRGQSPSISPVANARSPLTKQVTWALLGSASFSACQWVTILIIARLGTPTMVGQYALGLAISVPAFALSSFQLRNLQATDVAQSHPFGDYLSIRFVGTAVALAIIAVLIAISPATNETRAVAFIVAVGKAVETLSDIRYGLFQLHERLDLVARGMIWRGISGLVGLSAGLLIAHNMLIASAGWAVGWISVAILLDRSNTKQLLIGNPRLSQSGTGRFRVKATLRLLGLSAPLAAVLFFLNLSGSVPQIALHAARGDRELGLYAAALQLCGGIGFVYTAVGNAVLPRMARLSAVNVGELWAFTRKLFGCGLLLGSLAVAATIPVGHWLFVSVYGSRFREAGALLLGLMIAAVLNNAAGILGNMLTATRQLLPQFFSSALVLLMSVAATMILVPRFGMRGAMFTAFLAAVVQIILCGALCLRFMRKADFRQDFAAHPRC